MERTFTLEYWIGAGWYVGRLKEVPGVFSQGANLPELEENILGRLSGRRPRPRQFCAIGANSSFYPGTIGGHDAAVPDYCTRLMPRYAWLG